VFATNIEGQRVVKARLSNLATASGSSSRRSRRPSRVPIFIVMSLNATAPRGTWKARSAVSRRPALSVKVIEIAPQVGPSTPRNTLSVRAPVPASRLSSILPRR